jgi:ABC-type Na+ efflux pump permease subunit
MYQTLTFYHSIIRWLLLLALLAAVIRSFKGFKENAPFSKTDNAVRHWTATVAHIQLVAGILLYSQSPIIRYFWSHASEAIHSLDTTFFGVIHITLMLTSIVLITIGSSLAKRKKEDQQKHRTMLTWFGIALLIIFIAIPWPFSPLAQRPYIR